MNKPMNQKKIRRLMRKYNLFCPIRKANPYRRMQKAMKTNNYAANLLSRKFEAYGPRMVLLTDISYIPYNPESVLHFLYIQQELCGFYQN